MKNIHLFKTWSIILFVLFLFVQCGNESTESATVTQDFGVKVRLPSEPDRLNPLLSTRGVSRPIMKLLHPMLMDFSPTTTELTPQLVKAAPLVEEITEGEFAGGLAFTFEIHEEALWDNGSPITGKDLEFTLKTVFNPGVQTQRLRPWLALIKDIKINEANPKKFTILTGEKYILAEAVVSTNFVLPEYHYDPDGIMRQFDLKDLVDPAKAKELEENEQINVFAEQFNSTPFSREPSFVIGGGAYELVTWETGQNIVLRKKENWWGNALAQNFELLQNNPSEIIYQIMGDQTTAAMALRDGAFDVSGQMDAKDFIDLQKEESIANQYNFYTAPMSAYYFTYVNNKDEKLNDKRVRKALAHLMDVQDIIDKGMQGLGEAISGPVSPYKDYHHKNLPVIEYNVEKAQKLLTEAGWEDSNQNGTVDKTIDGKLEELELEMVVQAGSQFSTTAGLLFQNSAKKGGVAINLVEKDGRALRQQVGSRDYELAAGAFGMDVSLPDDFEQLWHTNSDVPNGFNRVGFGNAESDALIEAIKVTLDETKRNELYKQFQEIIYDQQPKLFICVPQDRIVINKKFEATPTVINPGYSVAHFKLKPNMQ